MERAKKTGVGQKGVCIPVTFNISVTLSPSPNTLSQSTHRHIFVCGI